MYAQFCTRSIFQIGQNDQPFGGYSLLLLGDFFQLEQIGAALYSANHTPGSASDKGIQLLGRFHQRELQVQHRCVEDQPHAQKISAMRSQYIHQSASSSTHRIDILQGLKFLSPTEDAMSFADATCLVASNLERSRINILAIKKFSLMHGYPLFRWRKPLDPGESNPGPLAASDSEELFDYFCNNCPAVLTTNLNPSLGLANGTLVRFHSLCLSPDSNLNNLKQFENVIEIPCPYAIKVFRQN